jgi:AcrR family transcriptional regulator
MGHRMSPEERREAIIAAALAVARRQGLARTTVREVAVEMGTSPGLIHHYFGSMDEVLAAAFELVAEADFERAAREVRATSDPVAALRALFATYAPADADWAFQLWLDAWAEAARRPTLQAVSREQNLAWHGLIAEVIAEGARVGRFTCPDPNAAAWRILSLLDGLALQVVAHGTTIARVDALRWTAENAERELDLPAGTLADVGRP